MGIALQIQRSVSGSVAQGANVIFNTTLTSLGNISYDNTTGIITLQETGTYKFDWLVATQTAPTANGLGFSLVSSQGDAIIGNSPIKTGEVVGFGIIEVSVSPVTVELKNNNTTVIYYSNIVPIAASLVVVSQAEEIVAANPNIETTSLGSINTVININEGGGNNQAFGGIVFPGDMDKVVSFLAAYIIQLGAGTGPFQMAILQPIGTSSAQVVSITNTVTTITGGLFVLPLTTPVTLLGNQLYYLAVYNQVNASTIGGLIAGTNSVANAPPINFRTQNLSGFTIGQVLSISDVALWRTPWLAALD